MKSVDELKSNEGVVMTLDGHDVAIYKNENGEIIKLSPVCTHTGCTVEWNNNDKTWDCPCHGSRFSPTGKIIHDPAKKDLERF